MKPRERVEIGRASESGQISQLWLESKVTYELDMLEGDALIGANIVLDWLTQLKLIREEAILWDRTPYTPEQIKALKLAEQEEADGA